MVAPSKSFTVIADGALDSDSPLTTTLMVNFRDNDIHLEEWLGDSFVAAKDHDHDGVNSSGLSAGGGAGLKLIERKEITADVANFDFAATLDGDTEKVYLLVARGLIGDRQVRLRANGADTGIPVADNTAGAGVQNTPFAAVIHALRTVQTVAVNLSVVSMQAPAVTINVQGGNVALGANLTSLGMVVSGPGTEIRKGSEFTLYELKQA